MKILNFLLNAAALTLALVLVPAYLTGFVLCMFATAGHSGWELALRFIDHIQSL